MGQEVRPQTEAENGQIPLVHQPTELINLRRRKKLALIGDDHVRVILLGVERINVVLWGNDLRRSFQANAGVEHMDAVPLVGGGF